jgi:hypothetical protein
MESLLVVFTEKNINSVARRSLFMGGGVAKISAAGIVLALYFPG